MTQMNGETGVDSTPGEGSTFWFKLPTRAEAEPEAVDDRNSVTTQDVKPTKILLAEDNPVNQKVLRLLLMPFEHDLTFVENGADAIEALEEDSFDLVLMDLSMPVIDGPSATRVIRGRKGPSSNTPIVALTANAMAGDREIYLAAGMNGYLSKPVSATKLVETIEPYRASPTQRTVGRAPLSIAPDGPPIRDTPVDNDSPLKEVTAELETWIAANSSRTVA